MSNLELRRPRVMTPAEHAARQVGTFLQARDYAGLRSLLSDDFTDHGAPPGTPPGPDGYVQVMRYVTETLGITYELEDVVAAGDQVAVRATARGVHDADAFGFPATGRPFAMSTMHWYRAQDGRLAEHWGVLDQLGMLAQVGALPRTP
jgi:predicted ester cyclase